jgi:hypothetical protein
MRSYTCTILTTARAAAILLVSCSDKSVEPPPPSDFEIFKDQLMESPRLDETAELMTLFVTGRAVAYRTDYDRMKSALDSVKLQFRDSIPQLDSAGFVYPTEVSKVVLVVSEAFKNALRNNEYTDWDSLNDLYYVTDIDTSVMAESSFVDLSFEPRLNSKLLAERDYSGLANTLGTGYYPITHDSSMIYPWRIGTVGDTHTFLLRISTGSGDFFDQDHRFWYFRVEDNLAELVGFFDWSTGQNKPDWWDEAMLGLCGRYHSSSHPFCIY